MKTLLVLLAIMAGAKAYSQTSTTITFNELPSQPVNGLTFRGVTFSFKILGTNSTDARFGGAGPGTLTYTSDPSLEGNTSGTLGFDFATPVSHLSFGVAVASFETLTPGVTVSLFDSSFTQLNKYQVTTRPMPTFSEALVTSDDAPVSHALLFFNNSGPRFVVDNLTFTPVPEPSTIVLSLAGGLLIGLGLWRRRCTR
jgi:hypothetical protein